jgi:hypothetical protein
MIKIYGSIFTSLFLIIEGITYITYKTSEWSGTSAQFLRRPMAGIEYSKKLVVNSVDQDYIFDLRIPFTPLTTSSDNKKSG